MPNGNAEVIYDSNRDGKWNNGDSRVVTDSEGDIGPNGLGLFMAATGNPKLDIDGAGIARLKAGGGHGRVYICVNNYNSLLQLDFNIESSNVEKLDLRVRSRHEEEGDCENRFGGFACVIENRKKVKFKTEKCHNHYENFKSESFEPSLKINEWYRMRFECKNINNDTEVNFTCWIDFNDNNGFIKIFMSKHKNPKNHYMKKTDFDKKSYIFIRSDNKNPASIALRNVVLTKLP